MDKSFERSQEIAEKNIEYFTQEEAESLFAENNRLKNDIKKLKADLEKQIGGDEK